MGTARIPPTVPEEYREEWLRCKLNGLYFVDTYCQIYDATQRDWIPFRLWDEQAGTLRTIINNLLVIILKARQLGLTWLVLAFALWLMLFWPASTVALFSRRDTEAVYLLSDERMRGMYARLPDWMKVEVTTSNDHEWTLANGSTAKAFPTTAGDSYTVTLAIVDEADLVPNLNQLMRAVKPTIDAGGQMILLSRSDKSRPQTEFKNIYRAAKKGLSDWAAAFLPWYVHPARDDAWYERQKRDVESRTGSLDDLHEQYPATDTEALSPRTLDKRIPPAWIEACYAEEPPGRPPYPEGKAPAVPNLEIYRPPQPGRKYVIGADPAEGNPTSDDSALEVVDKSTGEEVAAAAGKWQPDTLAGYAAMLSRWYNNAGVMVERNNHGHAVLLWLQDNSRAPILLGYDEKWGWLSSSAGKSMLYTECAELFRDGFRDGATLLHSFETWTQLTSIEGSTKRAPAGQRDDRADAYALANVGRAAKVMRRTAPGYVAQSKAKGWGY